MPCFRFCGYLLGLTVALQSMNYVACMDRATTDEQSAESDVNIKFKPKNIPADPLYTPISRFEYSERNTSAAYDLWNQTNITIVEWPGNVTKLEYSWPLLKWQNPKAKLVKNQCNTVLGLHFYGYAYDYVHLTWGPFRIMTSYCPPLKIPREIFRGKLLDTTDSFSVPVSDFEFVSDAFLLIVDNLYVVRVGNLEAAFLEEGVLRHDRNTLSYSIATGISHKIDKLVTQACCTREKTCRHGMTVFAYGSYLGDFSVLISFDGGKHFNKLALSKPPLSTTNIQLQAVIPFPELQELLVLYGEGSGSTESKSKSEIGRYCLKTGNFKSSNNSLQKVNGKLKAMRLGEEMSFIVWDSCRIWYSSDAGGTSLQPGLFYFHNTVLRKHSDASRGNHHVIRSENCHLEHSKVAYDRTGKIGLLDSRNNFFYSIDLKSTKYVPLVANFMDMTLMKKGTENSMVPYFDVNGRPKLLYPPKYLHCSHRAVNDEKFPKRLAVKLLPKTIFPSDFMPPFYDEHIPKSIRQFGISKCISSGLSIDSSLTQIPQVFVSTLPIQFVLEFKSFLNLTQQLHVEPGVYKNTLEIQQKLVDYAQLGTKHYFYFKYIITVTQIYGSETPPQGDFIRLNFYAVKSLRCVHQPQQTVWIQTKSTDSGNNMKKDNVLSNSISASEEVITIRCITSDEAAKMGSKYVGNVQTCEAAPGIY